jgi:hypothetical protein
LRGALVELRSSALQFGHSGLTVTLAGDESLARLAEDWSLAEDGVVVETKPSAGTAGFSLRLISPSGKVAREWLTCPLPAELGLELRKTIGPPDFGRLPLQQVHATD